MIQRPHVNGAVSIVRVPLFFLTKPFYNHEYPEAVSYGALASVLGEVIATELLLMYQGGITRSIIVKLKRGFIREFVPATRDRAMECHERRNGWSKFGFGIDMAGKILGTEMAFRAMSWTKKTGIFCTCFRLIFLSGALRGSSDGALAGYTAAQSFFVGRAQMSCLKSENASRLAGRQFDLNFEMVQSSEFQEAFSCSPGDPMYPETFCNAGAG